ncbi:MAG TPA: hypothetical protein VJU18_02380 [Vicinamibacteria bacterium]|nr:hypothetical protein [Vicinamibacteria bacterium]
MGRKRRLREERRAEPPPATPRVSGLPESAGRWLLLALAALTATAWLV